MLTRSRLFTTTLAFAFAGCGARAELGESSGTAATTSRSSSSSTTSSSGASPELARVRGDCAPNDGPALRLILDGSSDCQSATDQGISVEIWGASLAELAAGATLTLGADPNATAQASRVDPGGSVAVGSGTLSFTAYTQGQSAAGTYFIQFSDHTTAEGSFAAVWCQAIVGCG